MGAVDAFLMKAATYQNMSTSAWASYAAGFTRSLRGEDGTGALASRTFEQSADEFSKACASVLSLAETFYVAPQMNALVSAAAEDWQDDETVEADDFPTDHGWLFIPGGIASIDVRGSLYRTSALTWARRGAVVDVVLWADKTHDPPHLREKAHWERMPQMTPWHVCHLTLGQTLPVAMRLGKVLPPEVSQQVQWIDTPQGFAMSFPQGWTAEEMQPRFGPDPVLAWLVTTLRIMQQPLADVERVGLPVGVRKALTRHPRRVKNTHVTIIDFRRRLSDFEPGSGREYSHRFLRRGHWRRQWIGSERDGSRRQARVWIHATVVGPADKPLMLREHVNALTR